MFRKIILISVILLLVDQANAQQNFGGSMPQSFQRRNYNQPQVQPARTNFNQPQQQIQNQTQYQPPQLQAQPVNLDPAIAAEGEGVLESNTQQTLSSDTSQPASPIVESAPAPEAPVILKEEKINKEKSLEQELEEIEKKELSELGVEKHSKEKEALIISKQENANWLKNEPKKSKKNLARIKFPKDSEIPLNEDILIVKSILKTIEQNNIPAITVKSFASTQNDDLKEKQRAIRRSLALIKFMEDNGFPSQKIKVKIFSAKDNKSGFDYIDIDKI